MATLPNESQTQAIWSAAVDLHEEARKFGNVNSDNYVGLENTLSDALFADHANEVLAALTANRRALSSSIAREGVAAVYRPLLRTYMRVIGKPIRADDLMLDDLYDWCIANARYVTSRGISFGAVSAGTNVGNGTVHRITTDARGYGIDAVHAETKRARCIGDEHSGASEHEEVFVFEGEPFAKDLLELDGSGLVSGAVSALSARASNRFLDNASFSTLGGGTDGTPTSIFGWDINTIANVELGRGSGEFYRDFLGDTSPAGLKLKGNAIVSQNLNRRAVTVDPRYPYYLQAAVKRASSATGTITLRLGASSATVSLASLTNDVWNILRIGPGTANWFENWNEEDPTVEIELSSYGGSGHAWVDDVVFGPFTRFDMTYVAVVGGDTPFLRDDSFSFADTDGGAGKIQRWLWRTFGRYLPHSTGATVTWADP